MDQVFEDPDSTFTKSQENAQDDSLQLSVDFHSAVYPHDKFLVRWSPDGRCLAMAAGPRVVIRNAASMEIAAIFSCIDIIEALEWASDSDNILCGLYNRSAVQAFSVSDTQWSCRINEGAAGISYAAWSPDARHIVTVTEYQLSLSVWSLTNTQQAFHIKRPKEAPNCLAFNTNGSLFAVVTRSDCKDHISIYSVERWAALRTFTLDTIDCASIHWSPEGSVIAVRDTCLQYKLLVYDLEGRVKMRYQAYADALGIRSVAWSPSGKFLAVGSYDQEIRLIAAVTWSVVCELKHTHPKLLPQSSKCQGLSYYTEQEQEYIPRLPQALSEIRPDPNAPNPKVGVSMLSWSKDGRYLVSKNENMPNIAWVWDCSELGLCSVIVQSNPIKSARWSPANDQLALCTANGKTYFWTPSGASWLDVPVVEGVFDVMGLRWSPDGKSLVLLSRNSLCLCSFTQ